MVPPREPTVAGTWARHLPPGAEPSLWPNGQEAPGLTRLWRESWEKSGSRPAFFGGPEGRWVSASEVEERTARRAHWLASVGLTPGDRVAYSLTDRRALVEWHIAILRLGAVAVPVNPTYRRRELLHVLAASGAAAIVVDDPDHRRWAGECDHPVSVIDPVGAPPRTAEVPLDRSSGADPALLSFTSGTTGSPKGALLSHANLVAGARSVCDAWRWDEDDVLVLSLPLFHMHGLGVGLHGTLLAGACAVVEPAFDAGSTLAAITEHEASLFFGVPTMYARLVRHSDAGRLRRLRLAVSGSAPLAPELFRAVEAAASQRVLERYGMTETVMILSNPYDGERRAGSVGFELPGVEVRLADPAGERDDPGSATGNPGVGTVGWTEARQSGGSAATGAGGGGPLGEIEVRGPSVFGGYHEDPTATGRAFTGDGWFRTGDIARREADGYYRIVGRSTEVMISGGFNVYPREIENVLLELPEVAEAAVVGVPSVEWGETVTAFLVLDGAGIEASSVERHCADRLAPYKRPRSIHVVDELPRSALGKVSTADLRRLAADVGRGDGIGG